MTEPYVRDFQAFASNGAAGAPPWLREIREGAIARFTALGFPTMKQEAWRFTSVAPIAETHFTLPGSRRPQLALRDVAALSALGAGPRLVFVDGRYEPGLSSLAGLPEGVQATSLAEATRSGPRGELARRHLARYAPWQDSAFAALNTAFLADGAFVHVAADTVLAQPLEVLFLATSGTAVTGAGGPTVSHPRSLFIVERGARATLMESYASIADGLQWTNAVTETVVGEGARVELYRVQREGRNAYHIATTQSRQERDSYLGLHVLTLGGSLARHDITTVLDGTGAELILNGLYVLGGSQHADHHTVIDHARPHCASHEFFNGVLAERAHGVFNGRIIVRPGAQRTDSKQTNNNLLLSTEARADSQPQLEIYADDVKCTHGSTVGPLDQTALYYLRSRGLSPETAQSLVTYGFAAEILGRMQRPDVRERLDRLVRAGLA
ncbi:MAG: Fe-S cluster assembly protein SufD [Gemmatimonadetes bacterium 13_2_20CM_69_27]|nr:MAG: Fe-S cluster assembly protein SufD [Gemmatimonadetes bacterium 13_2_20CM_69_27]OLB52868.1 MAG: Fe-S cluster assembly protein SufD [Gemmatimonadetes bacterium 13_2_20CM_2_69_23]PYO30481.1 MAG: Fe-S cluster assembly protein SufD [Gemmatimonadota bacterium]PYP27433.1 MAG: Fe-S cluster assembly protein SufD [Gemmatimonadota bacterium]